MTKFEPTLTDAQIWDHNDRARNYMARVKRPKREWTEREKVLHILRARAAEPGLSQAEHMARWRRYKQVMLATRPKKAPTAERSAARS